MKCCSTVINLSSFWTSNRICQCVSCLQFLMLWAEVTFGVFLSVSSPVGQSTGWCHYCPWQSYCVLFHLMLCDLVIFTSPSERQLAVEDIFFFSIYLGTGIWCFCFSFFFFDLLLWLLTSLTCRNLFCHPAQHSRFRSKEAIGGIQIYSFLSMCFLSSQGLFSDAPK